MRPWWGAPDLGSSTSGVAHRGVSRHRDDGSVAAEFAVTLPAVLLVVALGVGALAAGVQAVRLHDAASDAARLIARDDATVRAHEVASDVGASLTIERTGDMVCANLTRRVGAPSALSVEMSARACALDGGR